MDKTGGTFLVQESRLNIFSRMDYNLVFFHSLKHTRLLWKVRPGEVES